ncbi:N-acetylmuramoyl-L-alanine amidase [Lentibacillus cibarius]|uniref:N-acetylmuramoyl-L-alanine amidase n=1 Tax=Lentibacillus cibarius TaxID=2583219 RepID=A0A5S3QJX1_9BACI|nr:N-acetylmuramoyl-L-alanine amidase [Lentibacillus cibarius]TMN22118.1 N-acetylmuramoyl-L-alanine amidase [Lentibacillus cibarius]
MGKLRIFMMTIGFLFLFALFSPTVHADDSNTYEVGTDSLHIRSGPSYDSAIIGTLVDGDRVTVFEEQYGWAQTYYGGQKAWVAGYYLIPAENTETSAEVAGSSMNTTKLIKAASDASGKLENYHIVLDAGHGGRDAGAIANNSVLEKNITLNTAISVAKELSEAGADVTLTRSDDTFIQLEDRVRISQTNETDAFISLHYNAFPLNGVNGFSTYYYADGEEQQFADDIQSALEQYLDLNSRGTRQNDYHVLRENSDLSILVELGFMTNPYDLSIIQTKEHRENVADGIVEGIMEYFNK